LHSTLKIQKYLVDDNNNGWNVYHPETEYNRLGVGNMNKNWRLSYINANYEHCKTYPRLLVVPASLSDEDLITAFKFRSMNRIPVLSYLNSRTGASICRCSQPMTGAFNKSSAGDQKLLSAILKANFYNQDVLHLLDARPYANAVANMALGGGFESTGSHSNYHFCQLQFLGIENIHVMRHSLAKLMALLESGDGNSPMYFQKLVTTGWLGHTSLLLSSASKVVSLLEDTNTSVVLHCSDGWDRTSQLVALALLMIDPGNRSLKGFQRLIEKEWLSFGHKFAQRCGHEGKTHSGAKSTKEDQRSPIFLQFMDAVYQIMLQFPCAFEFNEEFLIFVLENIYSCRFGTFLFDSEKERMDNQAKENTVSIWSYINDPDNVDQFINPFYEADNSLLIVSSDLEDMKVWKGYYARYLRKPQKKFRPEWKVTKLKRQNEVLIKTIHDLEDKLRQEKDKIAQLEQEHAQKKDKKDKSKTPKIDLKKSKNKKENV